jgi:hypothetical protein
MDEKEIQEFDLDDIIKEFADPDEEIREKTAEEILQEATAEVTAPQEPQEEEPQAQAPAGGDTIRFQPVDEPLPESATSDTVRFEPIGDPREEEEPAPQEPEEEKAEPYSDEWEPEYEQPMGEYVPAPPIVFKPKSRLRELKRQLVNGPEKQYYIQLEKGLGKLQAAIFFSLLVVLLSAGVMALYAVGWVPENRLRLMVFSQFFAMLVSALLGSYQLLEGAVDLFRRRFSLNTLLLITFIACCVDSVLCLQELRISVSSVFALEMTLAIWAAYDRRSAELGMMDTLRKASRLDSVVCVPDYYQGKPGICTGQGEVEHFMDYYDRPSSPEKVLNWYAFSTLLVSLAAGIMGGIRHGFSTGVQLCAAALLLGMPATAFLSTTRPLAILEKRLHRLGSVLCGWKGIRAAVRKAAYPLEDQDLFPAGAARLNGMKFYGDQSPDLVVAYTTAMIKANRGALVGLFSQLLDSRNGFYYTVNDLTTHPGGVTGEINGESVAVGCLDFMRDMGVDVSEAKPMDQAVYVAIDGSLSGMFAVNYQKSRSTKAGLQTLCSYPGLTPVINCEDFMLTGTFVQKKFGINPRRIAFPSQEERREMSLREVAEADPVIALTTKEGLAPKAFAFTGARVLRSALKAGVAVHMVGGIIGLLSVLAMAWVGPHNILTPSNILLYQLIWMIPGLLITEWTRNI